MLPSSTFVCPTNRIRKVFTTHGTSPVLYSIHNSLLRLLRVGFLIAGFLFFEHSLILVLDLAFEYEESFHILDVFYCIVSEKQVYLSS